jgi:RimJ/RimL family protein N-acetyltransferase
MNTLRTARLVLEPLLVAHAHALYPLLAEPAMSAFLDHGAPTSLEALRERYRKLESRRSPDGNEQWLNWAILVQPGAGGAIGCVQATVCADRSAWVAYEVGVAWWGRGIATEATRAMLDELERGDAVTRMRATVDRRNERSWRLLQRLGFTRATPADARALRVSDVDWLYQR